MVAMLRRVVGYAQGLCLVLSGCVGPEYVDWKILQAKVEKLDERLTTLESLAVTTDARVNGLSASMQGMSGTLKTAEVDLTQRIREEREQEIAEIERQVTTLEETVEAVGGQVRGLVQTGVTRQVVLHTAVYFDAGQTTLSQEATTILDAVGAELATRNVFGVDVSGYADQEGAKAHNLDISRKRAEAVAEYLSTHFGLDRHSVSVAGFGESSVVSSGDTTEQERQDRRVEITAFVLSLSRQ